MTVRVILIFWTFFFFLGAASAQKEDFHWQLGYKIKGDQPHGTSISFTEDTVLVNSRLEGPSDFHNTNTGISDSEGNLLFYTNGGRIFNRDHQVMKYGDSLSPNFFSLMLQNENKGQRLKQNILILPWPGRDSLYLILHHYLNRIPGSYPVTDTLYRSIINMTRDNGYGAVVEKNVKVLYDEHLKLGRITAARHANGRDWWILAQRKEIYGVHRFLFSKRGLEHLGIQEFSIQEAPYINNRGSGQAVFSPDGSKYAFLDKPPNRQGQVTIYNFDRCTGLLQNPKKLEYPIIGGHGIAFSPNSRFLYASSGYTLYQFDLYATDIQASKTIIAEAKDLYCPPTIPLTFNYLQLAPNGKIYISGWRRHCYLSTIEYPDRAGIECTVVQHELKLKSRNYRSLPDFPHFRLGPLHGCPCDTLGIERQPVARFREEPKDSTDPFTLRFTDLSWYQPFEWQWSFGDGQTDTVQHPDHSYADTGSYTVCLTVTNADGEDTACDTVQVTEQTTDASGPERHKTDLKVYPVPADESITIDGLGYGQIVFVYNIRGRLMDRFEARGTRKVYPIDHLPAGMYWIRTSNQTAKFIKLK